MNRTSSLESRAHRLQLACQAAPYNLIGWHNYGETLRLLKRFDESKLIFKRVLASAPNFLPAYVSLKPVLIIAHARALAENDHSKCLEVMRELSMVCNNQGNALLSVGAGAAATDCYRQALSHFTKNGIAMSNLGDVLRQAGNLSEAEYWCRTSLTIDPDLAAAWNNLGAVLSTQGGWNEAQTCYERALALDPNMAMAKHNAGSGGLFNLQMAPYAKEAAIFDKHQAWGRLHQAERAVTSANINPEKWRMKLRVGYLSADFREHAMRHFLEPMLAHHDCNQFEVYCYAQVQRPDSYTERFMSYGHTWRWIHLLSDEQLDQQIRADAIDILIDCMGHTQSTRLTALKNKPAPVMMSWLGYLGTSGLPSMDYRLTDEWADPVGVTDSYHSEALLRMPGGMLCYQPHDKAPDVQDLPALSQGYVTFGSLNNLSKVNIEVVKAWAEILVKCPRSRLIFQAKDLVDGGRRSWLLGAFEALGVEPNRVTLKPADGNFLNTYGSIDIALDTFPYGGGATTCDALWMGVPVVTWSGRRSAGRLTTSLLHQIDRSVWVTQTLDDYISKACQMAGDLNSLAQERAALRTHIQKSTLCDQIGFVRRFEALLKSDISASNSKSLECRRVQLV